MQPAIEPLGTSEAERKKERTRQSWLNFHCSLRPVTSRPLRCILEGHHLWYGGVSMWPRNPEIKFAVFESLQSKAPIPESALFSICCVVSINMLMNTTVHHHLRCRLLINRPFINLKLLLPSLHLDGCTAVATGTGYQFAWSLGDFPKAKEKSQICSPLLCPIWFALGLCSALFISLWQWWVEV